APCADYPYCFSGDDLVWDANGLDRAAFPTVQLAVEAFALQTLVSMANYFGHAAGIYSGGGRLDGDRGGPTTLDHIWYYADGGCCILYARAGCYLLYL